MLAARNSFFHPRRIHFFGTFTAQVSVIGIDIRISERHRCAIYIQFSYHEPIIKPFVSQYPSKCMHTIEKHLTFCSFFQDCFYLHVYCI